MPGRQVFGLGQALEEFAHIGIGLGIGDLRSIVDVPALLPPGVEHDLFPGMIGVQRGNYPFDGIVEERRTHPYTDIELVAVGSKRAALPPTHHLRSAIFYPL